MENKIINVLDKGFVELLNVMGDDFTPARDARISTGSDNSSEKDNINLIRFLLRHRHTTPFQLVQIKCKIKCPIFVIREAERHRLLTFTSRNEESGRYKKLDPDYYLPDIDRIKKQSTTNRQGSGDNFTEDESKKFIEDFDKEQQNFEKTYNYLIDDKCMANELARINMPLSHYSTFIVSGDLLNWFRFLQLRMAQDAQFEIRMYANAIAEIIKEQFPICYQAFEDYWLNAVTFSMKEMEYIKKMVNECLDERSSIDFDKLKGRELQEFKDKLGI